MLAAFDDASFVYDENLVGVHDGGQSMGDDECGPSDLDAVEF